ncbi:MAG: hypothetical protein KJ018_11540 [Burkholderiales bacterium]|nr:hypothetical protein [Burkholderiales bacterium]
MCSARAQWRVTARQFALDDPRAVLIWIQPGCMRVSIGTKDALLAAGVCTAAQFPEGRKRAGGAVSVGHVKYWSMKKLRGPVFELLESLHHARSFSPAHEWFDSHLYAAREDKVFQKFLAALGGSSLDAP